jgi:hypothetical protein
MKVEERYSNGYRFYIIDGVAHASNTSILKLLHKDKILGWAISKTIEFIANEGDLSSKTLSKAYRYHSIHLQELADSGTAKHDLASNYIKFDKYVKDPWLDKFIAWKEKEKFQTLPRLSEVFVYNSRYRIAGRVDIIGKIHGTPIGIDIKTSSNVYNSHKIQCCGYNLMLKYPIKWAILNITRDAKRKRFKVLTEKELTIYTKLFLHLNEIFHILWENGDLEVDIPY